MLDLDWPNTSAASSLASSKRSSSKNSISTFSTKTSSLGTLSRKSKNSNISKNSKSTKSSKKKDKKEVKRPTTSIRNKSKRSKDTSSTKKDETRSRKKKKKVSSKESRTTLREDVSATVAVNPPHEIIEYIESLFHHVFQLYRESSKTNKSMELLEIRLILKDPNNHSGSKTTVKSTAKENKGKKRIKPKENGAKKKTKERKQKKRKKKSSRSTRSKKDRLATISECDSRSHQGSESTDTPKMQHRDRQVDALLQNNLSDPGSVEKAIYSEDGNFSSEVIDYGASAAAIEEALPSPQSPRKFIDVDEEAGSMPAPPRKSSFDQNGIDTDEVGDAEKPKKKNPRARLKRIWRAFSSSKKDDSAAESMIDAQEVDYGDRPSQRSLGVGNEMSESSEYGMSTYSEVIVSHAPVKEVESDDSSDDDEQSADIRDDVSRISSSSSSSSSASSSSSSSSSSAEYESSSSSSSKNDEVGNEVEYVWGQQDESYNSPDDEDYASPNEDQRDLPDAADYASPVESPSTTNRRLSAALGLGH